MFKKFIGITSLAVVAALSSTSAFADNKAQEIIDSPAYTQFFKLYDNYISGAKDIVKKNSIQKTEEGTIIYSFAQGQRINLDNNVLDSGSLTDGHINFVKTIAESYNSIYAKGYYKTQAQVNVHLDDKSSYSFYNVADIKRKFDEVKSIFEHNAKIHLEIGELNKKVDEFIAKYENVDEDTYDKAMNSPEYKQLLDDVSAKSSELKQAQPSVVSREFSTIEQNQDLFDRKKNPSQLFVIGGQSSFKHKNYMFSKSDASASKGMEQCSTILSVDKNGDQVSFLPLSFDKTTMVFGSDVEKQIFYKFILFHELAHCEFSMNDTTKLKSYSLGDKEVDKVINDLFNNSNSSRYSNPFNRHFQEHYADVYATMILLREESNPDLVLSILDKISSLRSIGALNGDYEHLSTYSLEQIKHPEILAKIQSLPIDKLADLAMDISNKGVSMTLANSTEFQNYLNNKVLLSFSQNVIKAITHAVDNTDFKTEEYHEQGLGDKNSYINKHAEKLTTIIKEEMKKNPNLKSEMKLFLASNIAALDSNIQIPTAIQKFEYSQQTTEFQNSLFLNSVKIADTYFETNLNFNQLGKKLQSTLQQKSFEPTMSISVSSLIKSPTNSSDLSPSSLPSDINLFLLKTSLDKDTLKNKIDEVTKKALESRNEYLNGNNNINVNKL
jgi:hypothetical protein